LYKERKRNKKRDLIKRHIKRSKQRSRSAVKRKNVSYNRDSPSSSLMLIYDEYLFMLYIIIIVVVCYLDIHARFI
jgi:hypothetical protein